MHHGPCTMTRGPRTKHQQTRAGRQAGGQAGRQADPPGTKNVFTSWGISSAWTRDQGPWAMLYASWCFRRAPRRLLNWLRIHADYRTKKSPPQSPKAGFLKRTRVYRVAAKRGTKQFSRTPFTRSRLLWMPATSCAKFPSSATSHAASRSGVLL